MGKLEEKSICKKKKKKGVKLIFSYVVFEVPQRRSSWRYGWVALERHLVWDMMVTEALGLDKVSWNGLAPWQVA